MDILALILDKLEPPEVSRWHLIAAMLPSQGLVQTSGTKLFLVKNLTKQFNNILGVHLMLVTLSTPHKEMVALQ